MPRLPGAASVKDEREGPGVRAFSMGRAERAARPRLPGSAVAGRNGTTAWLPVGLAKCEP